MNDEIRKELEELLGASGETHLSPKAVYRYAKENKGTATGRWFAKEGAFDAKRAVAGFGRFLAGRLLRIIVVRVESPPVTVRKFVSLLSERGKGQDSYRPVETVMGDTALRAEHLRTILAQLVALRLKYAYLGGLGNVWKAIDNARAALEAKS